LLDEDLNPAVIGTRNPAQELTGKNRGKPNRAEIYEQQYPLSTGVRVVLGGWRPDAGRLP
jgi:hypothetical protein